MKKIIYNITPFTTVDYKDHLSCIAWFVSCNMRCKYCYNSQIVNAKSGNYTPLDLIAFLKKRIGLLDAVVLSGGEATNHNLLNLCRVVKKLGYKIKLDTNGLKPDVINELIQNQLIDFIALDYKAPQNKFTNITKINSNKKFTETLDMLIKDDFPFEVRTTVHPNLIDEEDINSIILDLEQREYKGTYYLQNYLHTQENLGNMQEPNKILNKTLLNSSLKIEYRNY
ncbi:anaerobic ribonucleoside-triphosphate reductase activating protein [Halarcobacter ebronensis]|uniref:Anaerobic ribonucleoside-triphosphate reductase activating protein n=1 Tax=Halarcobacter ebronensis TaxID=1462615 RepID=A0A4Q1ANX1_9BACT|nr:anaerobic ribonucleoside-triphosphate reductase activating protein [Halarcobacter ebronensis]QKF81993.1 anaerobic ribonucleoside triphosphate reductase activating protein [Halarcobacter ebronensis]RXK04293.1 anaerobic ribonucleoside-triphosphate reductase activating protein [Halarcobacter ebronensis]